MPRPSTPAHVAGVLKGRCDTAHRPLAFPSRCSKDTCPHRGRRTPFRVHGGLRSLWPLQPLSRGAAKPGARVALGPLKVSQMGLGTWAWGNQLLWGYNKGMDDELQQLFNLAVDSGVNLFDTADSYGTGRLNGRSEQLLGKFLQERPAPQRGRTDVVIATKLAAYPWRVTPQQFVGACKASLKRLGLQSLGIGQLHWSTANYQPLQERALWGGLAAMYEQGLVKAVGVSNYGPRQLERIHAYLSKHGVPLASAQIQFSLLSRGQQQMEVKAACEALGMKLIAYSPLGLGMLTGKYAVSDTLPPGPRALLFRQILPGIQPLLDCQRTIAQARGKTMSQVAINWCLCQDTIPIPGAKTLATARDNLGALGWRLTPMELAALESAADEAPRGMIQNIFQTR